MKIKSNYQNNSNVHISEWFNLTKDDKTVGSVQAALYVEVFTKNFLGRPPPLTNTKNNNSRRVGSRSLTPSHHEMIDPNLTTVTPVHGPLFGQAPNDNSDYNFFSTENSNDSVGDEIEEGHSRSQVARRQDGAYEAARVYKKKQHGGNKLDASRAKTAVSRS